MMKKNTVFHCIAGYRWGAGHVMRCMKIARALKNSDVCFVITGDIDIRKHITQLVTFPCITVEDNEEKVAEAIASKCPSAVIIDRMTYGVEKIKQRFDKKTKVIALDNYAEGADAYINIRKEQSFKPKVPQFNGYQFWALEQPKKKKSQQSIKELSSILLTMGYSDPYHMTEHIVDYLEEYDANKQIMVVVTPLFSKKTVEYLRLNKIQTTMTKDMEKLMMETDMCIVAGGNTMMESIARNIPTLVIPNDEKNNEVAEMLARDSLIIKTSQFPIKKEELFVVLKRIGQKGVRSELVRATEKLEFYGIKKIIELVEDENE